MALTQDFDLSEDALRIYHIFKCLMNPLYCNLLVSSVVFRREHVAVGARAYTFLDNVTIVNRDDAVLRVELGFPLYLARKRAHNVSVRIALRLPALIFTRLLIAVLLV